MNLKENLGQWWMGRMPREQRLLKTAGVLLVVVLLYTILSAEFTALARAREDVAAKQQELYQGRMDAASLSREKERLEQTRAKWETVKAVMSRNVETGITLADIEWATKKQGAQLVALEPGEPVVKIYRGHLRAVPFKVTIRGEFPQVLGALKELEKLANPGEIRFIKISAANKQQMPEGSVTAEEEIILYSLNPPEWQQSLEGIPTRVENAFLPLVLLPETPKPQLPPLPSPALPDQPGAGDNLARSN